MAGHLVIVPTQALKDQRLSHAEFKTLCHISTFASTKTGWCWFLMSTLAEEMGLTIRVVRGHVKRLVDLGYIVREAQFKYGQQRCNRYQVVLNLALRGAADKQPGGAADEQPGGAADEQPPERSFFNDKKEKKALTRDEFLREIDNGYRMGAFGEFQHLTETEIMAAAQDCLDFYSVKDIWPSTDPVPVLRHWIRGGIRNGAIRKASKEKPAGGSKPKAPALPLQPDHERLKPHLPEAEFDAWIRPLSFDGETIIAPSRFHADTVRGRYGSLLGGRIIIFSNPKEETPSHV
jgi:hypothetical protein